ncbi:MAG: response regulator transcription factor [Verrucomicrobia bacterium]|nr:response regulator transcription factor [Verrucomicrobiota bacterium]
MPQCQVRGRHARECVSEKFSPALSSLVKSRRRLNASRFPNEMAAGAKLANCSAASDENIKSRSLQFVSIRGYCLREATDRLPRKSVIAPKHPKRERQVMSADAPTSDETRTPLRVWIVEDNAAYRASAARVIARIPNCGEVRTFPDCEETFSALAVESPPDILLLDLGLRGISGLEGLSRFKALAPELKILVLTSSDDHDRIFKAVCGGASGYLLKRAPLAKLNDAIREVLGGGAPMSPPVASAVLNMFAQLGGAKPSRPDYGLAPREKQTLEGMVQGLTVKEIADRMQVSYHTADTYVRNIYAKLHVHSRAGAAAKAIRERL